jgi:hypothetical protein
MLFEAASLSPILSVLAEATRLTWHNLFSTVDGLVAIGTIGLAAATAILALKTASLAGSTREEAQAVGREIELSRQTLDAVRDQADAIREQAETARGEVEVMRAGLETQIRPVLVDVRRPTDPAELAEAGGQALRYDRVAWEGTRERRHVPIADVLVWEAPDAVFFSVPLRNVGPGMAFVREVGFRWPLDRELDARGAPTMGVVPPYESMRIQFAIWKRGDRPTLAEFENYGGGFAIDVVYTDVAGAQWSRTTSDIQRDHEGRWHVRRVYLHRKHSERGGVIDWGDPVVSSGPAWAP